MLQFIQEEAEPVRQKSPHSESAAKTSNHRSGGPQGQQRGEEPGGRGKGFRAGLLRCSERGAGIQNAQRSQETRPRLPKASGTQTQIPSGVAWGILHLSKPVVLTHKMGIIKTISERCFKN